MATLLQAEHLTKTLGPRVLFEDLSFAIHEGERYGFIGRNGEGKTTLLKMLTGEEAPERGSIRVHDIARIGYLEQHTQFVPGESIEAFLERLSNQPAWRCAKVAAQFRLSAEYLTRPIQSCSGGEQMRARLAALFLAEPTLLLLDEPTNYLDVQTQLLLEAVLADYAGSFVIISHDREFLMRTCTETMELDRGILTLFPGDVESYFLYKQERDATLARENKSIEQQKKHLETFINRFRAKASKASQAQSKMKALARLNTKEIRPPAPRVTIHIPQVEWRNTFALRATHLAIGYPEKTVVSEIDVEIQRGQHVAIVGENGQGKTTFLQTLAGRLPEKAGTFTYANRLRVGLYDQKVRAALHPDETVEQYLTRSAPDLPRQEILAMAGDFLFREDDREKPTRVLSGGEAARLVLAGLCLGRFEVLLLDEPTNHLDFDTVEALAEALAKYKGTILFVSHDRGFVNRLADVILDVRDGRVHRYPGTYAEYVQDIRHDLALDTALAPSDAPPSPKESRAERHAKLTERKRAWRKLEKELQELEMERETLLRWFTEHPTERIAEQSQRLHTVVTMQNHLEEEWVKLGAEIENLERGEGS